MKHPPRRLQLVPMLVATWLAGCGGGDADDLAAPLLLDGVQVVSPLRDDEGGLTAGDPAALPTQPGLRARLAHHATAAQADQLEAALGSAAVSVRLDGTDGATETAVAVVRGLQQERQLGPEAPVLLRGSDLRLAVATADQLAALGHTQVFVVTP